MRSAVTARWIVEGTRNRFWICVSRTAAGTINSALKDFFDSGITRNAVAIDDCRMRLWVQVYQQGGLPKLCQAIGQIHCDRGFADAPLLVQDGDFHSTRLPFASHKCYMCNAESYTQVLQSVVPV